MECLVLVHDASFSFVVDLVASITGYRVQASDITKHEEKGPFIFAVQRERVGQSGERSPRLQGLWPTSLIINVASLDSVIRTEPNLHLKYDHEYHFWPTKFSCKGFSRFLTLVTGQSDPLAQIKSKQRSAYIGLTYPDIRVSLSNMPIVSVGADALELRVDLLREEDHPGDIPTLGYVAEQLAALRLQSELPIIFTIRLEPSGGR
jgi:3-dehydroquinate dehydratase-1